METFEPNAIYKIVREALVRKISVIKSIFSSTSIYRLNNKISINHTLNIVISIIIVINYLISTYRAEFDILEQTYRLSLYFDISSSVTLYKCGNF